MRIDALSLLALLMLAVLAPAARADELAIRIERNGDDLALSATIGGETTHVRVERATASRLMAVRFSLECMEDPKDCPSQKPGAFEAERLVFNSEELSRVLNEASAQVLKPLTAGIQRAQRIRIIVPSDLLKLPVDTLHVNGKPLFLQKPIVYTLDRNVVPSNSSVSPSSSALLISDPDTDPDRAVFAVAERFPFAERLDAGDVDPLKLQVHPPVALAVISAHGRAGYEGDDFMLLPNNHVLSPALIAGLRPRLVYLDSCNLGISMRYLEALRAAGVTYVLAPVVSNEAGNSSSLTVRAYFQRLSEGIDPVVALYLAKQELYSAYAKDELLAMLWRVFPFRIYALN